MTNRMKVDIDIGRYWTCSISTYWEGKLISTPECLRGHAMLYGASPSIEDMLGYEDMIRDSA
jgi:hypothetical protein